MNEGASNAEIWHGAQEMLATQRSELLRQTDHGEHFCGGLIPTTPTTMSTHARVCAVMLTS